MRRALVGFVVAAALGLPQIGFTAAGPQRGGTLAYALDTSPDRLDPNLSGLRPAQIVFFQIFDPLVVRDPKDNAIKPWLAASWTVSPDGKVYTFRLRPGVKFQDGTPFDAAAVMFNFDRTHR
jgi:peptide/nickel transport system substrate-binding protein